MSTFEDTATLITENCARKNK